MYYSEPQMELLKVVRILGCLERRQARALLRLRYGVALEAADNIIRQLKCDGKIKTVENTGLILSPDGKEDSCILRAIDIALCFAEPGNGPEILPCKPDYLLYAYYPDNPTRLWILHVPEGMEQEKSMLVDYAQDTAPAQSVYVMLLDSVSQTAYISAASPCILAYPDQNGRLQLKNWEGK